MFVFTTKLTKTKLITAVIVAAVLLCAIIVLASCLGSQSKEPEPYDHTVIAIKSNDDRVAFLTSFGWDASSQPVAAEEVRIPDEFDETFAKYNELQKSQSYDLENYKGKRVKRYTYEITNYPTGEQGIVANLLVYQDSIIGGDICSPTLNGFMHGFTKPK